MAISRSNWKNAITACEVFKNNTVDQRDLLRHNMGSCRRCGQLHGLQVTIHRSDFQRDPYSPRCLLDLLWDTTCGQRSSTRMSHDNVPRAFQSLMLCMLYCSFQSCFRRLIAHPHSPRYACVCVARQNGRFYFERRLQHVRQWLLACKPVSSQTLPC